MRYRRYRKRLQRRFNEREPFESNSRISEAGAKSWVQGEFPWLAKTPKGKLLSVKLINVLTSSNFSEAERGMSEIRLLTDVLRETAATQGSAQVKRVTLEIEQVSGFLHRHMQDMGSPYFVRRRRA